MLKFKTLSPDFIRKPRRELHLSEAYDANQDMPEFAIMAADGQQIGAWMRCKDYIQDVVWGSKREKKYSVHGWDYDPKLDPRVSDKWLILAMRWKSKTRDELNKAIANVKATVEDLEKRLGVPKFQRSRFTKAMGDYFVIYGGQKWLHSPGTVSLFTWVLRSALLNDEGTFDAMVKKKKFAVSNDGYYLRQGKIFIDTLLEVGFNGMSTDWDTIEEPYSVHGGGFVGQSYKLAQQKGIKVSYDDYGF